MDQYPNTFDKAARILGNYQTTRVGMPYKASPNNPGMAFLQQGGQGGRGAGHGGQGGCGQKNDGRAGTINGAGANGVSTMTWCTGANATRTNSKGESHCFNCGSPSHWAYECPQLSGKQQAQLHMNIEAQEDGNQEQPKEGHQLLNVTLAQGGAMPDNPVYLDGCLTVTAFKSGQYLKGIKMVQGGIKINCNTGAVVTNKRGTYGGLKVWYLPSSIANIISMHELKKLYRITYDSWKGYYIVHTPKGEVQSYKDEQGLPYLDLEESNHEAMTMLLQCEEEIVTSCNGAVETVVLFMQMVRGNYEGFTKRKVVQAKEAHQAQAMLGNLSKKDYKGMVSNNLIVNCPITSSNVTNEHRIFGPDLASIQGKTVRRLLAPVVAAYVAVPRGLVDANKVITQAADVFFVDGTAFLLTISRRIKFVTTEHVPVRTVLSLSKHLKRVLEVYGRAGFRVRTIIMDGEFGKIKPLMPNVECNMTAAKEHISKAERTIQTVKERTRGLLATLPFTHMPK
jgi:hypothetical protein